MRHDHREWSLRLDRPTYSAVRRVQARLVLLDGVAMPLADVVQEAVRVYEREVAARAGQATALRGDGRDAAPRPK